MGSKCGVDRKRGVGSTGGSWKIEVRACSRRTHEGKLVRLVEKEYRSRHVLSCVCVCVHVKGEKGEKGENGGRGRKERKRRMMGRRERGGGGGGRR